MARDVRVSVRLAVADGKGRGCAVADVIAYRTEDTVRQERRFGFDHSHNTKVNWDDWKGV
jgi:hypothetical protein